MMNREEQWCLVQRGEIGGLLLSSLTCNAVLCCLTQSTPSCKRWGAGPEAVGSQGEFSVTERGRETASVWGKSQWVRSGVSCSTILFTLPFSYPTPSIFLYNLFAIITTCNSLLFVTLIPPPVFRMDWDSYHLCTVFCAVHFCLFRPMGIRASCR